MLLTLLDGQNVAGGEFDFSALDLRGAEAGDDDENLDGGGVFVPIVAGGFSCREDHGSDLAAFELTKNLKFASREPIMLHSLFYGPLQGKISLRLLWQVVFVLSRRRSAKCWDRSCRLDCWWDDTDSRRCA